jgi:hypothetical protein
MSAKINLKLYRKLLVLFALSFGLLAASSIRKTEASACCDYCDQQYNYCVTVTCATSDRQCVKDICDPQYSQCIIYCDRC